MHHTPQVKILQKAMDLIESSGKNKLEAYNDILHFLAYMLGIEGAATPFLQSNIHDKVKATLDLDILRAEKWDWLGELYEKNRITNPRTGQFFTPKAVSDMMAVMNAPAQVDVNKPKRMLDPCVGSGRLIISMYNLVGTGFIYYGADIDLVAYRTALVNMALFKIPAKILRCNSLTTDLSPNSPNWQYANMWEPVAERRLKKINPSS